MKIGIIIETKENEKAWNGLRFANTALKGKHEVKVFLMGEAVEIVEVNHEKYDIAKQIERFNEEGGQLLACGTCLVSRKLDDEFTACPISTMVDCLEMVEWSDKMVTF